MTDVIKKDGRRERFDQEKLKDSIVSATREAGLMNRRWVDDVIENVSASAIAFSRGKKEVEAKTLREMILSDLDKLEKKIADAWREFDKTK
ncbi:MAG: transcriptional regulator NrdR [Candidatus Methanofastidiosum methylothiophilum]|uniref:Transcriptional regulator NrdR n=1 Tax=Candidatus Methanofastidiosum methylothiophilum TaxID=1705564 RepID=A0A150IKD9_9EURY|nr:MAG: transcriptional regulator NrdR [Candidatus Methanofastidiosum methylthiophilus]